MYGLLRKPVPDELFVSNISGLGTPPAQTAPTALLAPTVDGEETSYFEWLGAGSYAVYLMARQRGAANRKARDELGFAPSIPSWRTGFRDRRDT